MWNSGGLLLGGDFFAKGAADMGGKPKARETLRGKRLVEGLGAHLGLVDTPFLEERHDLAECLGL